MERPWNKKEFVCLRNGKTAMLLDFSKGETDGKRESGRSSQRSYHKGCSSPWQGVWILFIWSAVRRTVIGRGGEMVNW